MIIYGSGSTSNRQSLTGNASLLNRDVPTTDGTMALGSSAPAKPALMACEPKSNTMLGSASIALLRRRG